MSQIFGILLPRISVQLIAAKNKWNSNKIVSDTFTKLFPANIKFLLNFNENEYLRGTKAKGNIYARMFHTHFYFPSVLSPNSRTGSSIMKTICKALDDWTSDGSFVFIKRFD